MKVKAKVYADRKRNAEYSDLVPGNRVLLHCKRSKTSCQHHLHQNHMMIVVSRNGSSFTSKSTEVVQLKRNTAHVKK